MPKISIMIADDMPNVAEYYKMILECERDFEVVAIANSGKQAYEYALALKPDVILMDIQMETEVAGITATKKIKSVLPETKVIMLTSHNDSNNITESFVAGAVDFLTTDSSVVEILGKIKDYSSSENENNSVKKALVDEVMKLQRENKSLLYVLVLISRLSKSEMQILKLIAQGKTYRQIASERTVEEVTIRSMVNKMKKKLGVDSLREIANALKESDILDQLFD